MISCLQCIFPHFEGNLCIMSFDNKERRKISYYVIEISNTVFGNQTTCHLVITLNIINTAISAAQYLICNGP